MTHPLSPTPHIIHSGSNGTAPEVLWRLLATHREELRTAILDKGGLLLRGFALQGAEHFKLALSALFPEQHLQTYSGGLGHKKHYQHGIYSSTEVPSRIHISPHHEMAYLPKQPKYIAFLCNTPAQRGGRTSIVCGHQLYSSMDRQVRDKFERLGICYTRTYPSTQFGSRLGFRHPILVSWKQVFSAQTPDEVEQRCTQLGLKTEWFKHDTLQTRVVLPAVRIHPEHQQKIWYNQAHTFVVTRKYLGSWLFFGYRLLYNFKSLRQGEASFGNGEPIPAFAIDAIHSALKKHPFLVSWEAGDLLILDNQRMMHGREAYRGRRELLTAML